MPDTSMLDWVVKGYGGVTNMLEMWMRDGWIIDQYWKQKLQEIVNRIQHVIDNAKES